MAWSRSNRRPCKKSNVKSGSCSITLKCLQQLSLSALCSFTKPCTAQSSKCISPLSGWQSPRGSDVQMRAGWSERERDTELPHRMSLLQFKWDLKKKKKKNRFRQLHLFLSFTLLWSSFFFSPRSWKPLSALDFQPVECVSHFHHTSNHSAHHLTWINKRSSNFLHSPKSDSFWLMWETTTAVQRQVVVLHLIHRFNKTTIFTSKWCCVVMAHTQTQTRV